MFQFGYEQRGAPSAGLLALDGLANPLHSVKLAGDAHKFVDTVTIYTNANADLAAENLSLATNTRHPCRQPRNLPPGACSRSFQNVLVLGNQYRIRHRGNSNRILPGPPPLDETETHATRAVGPGVRRRGRDQDVATVLPDECGRGACASMMKIIPNAISMGAYAGVGMARELPKGGCTW